MNLDRSKIRGYRLRAHHLDAKLPAEKILDAAGACGIQNTPPGAFETALYLRLQDSSLTAIQDALYREKILLQAWSYRGVPAVFPTKDSDIFLTALISQEGEEPWIYTRGVSAGLEYTGLSLSEALQLVKDAAASLEGRVIVSKEELDRDLADRIQKRLPEEKKSLWTAPSMYGRPDRQTVGQAIVSFLLRPCSFSSLVVFGERCGQSPSFTSYRSWTGQEPALLPDAGKELVRRFLHCYGPSSPAAFADWLGSSRRQAQRLWDSVSCELTPLKLERKNLWMLTRDIAELLSAEEGDRLLLIGPHDPYLDLRDREIVLEDTVRQRQVFRTVANPGAILRGGRIIGIWSAKSEKGKIRFSLRLWDGAGEVTRRELNRQAEEYAAFRGLTPDVKWDED